MAAGTALNESLACVALAYLSYRPEATLDDFYEFITKNTENIWTQVTSKCEISEKSISSYRSAYKDVGNQINPWIYTSYNTAIAIKDSLKINLKDYKFCKVEKTLPTGSLLKQKATSAIKKHAKATMKASDLGILATLNADKLNIADIFVIKNKSNVLDSLKNLIEETDVTEKQLQKKVLEQKDLLNVVKYKELFNLGWRNKEIFSVSLKALDKTTDTIPTKTYNIPTTFQTRPDNEDEFAVFLSALVNIASKPGNTQNEFEDAIDKFVTIRPNIKFTAQDRLLVYFDLNYKKGKQEYHIFTNFGSGNAIHFVPKGSTSASGEGGITINYFYTLAKEFPELKKFFLELSDTRIRIFEESCQKYNVNSKTVNEKLGSNSIYSGKYHSSLYLASDYEKLIEVMSKGANLYGFKTTKNVTSDVTANIEVLQEFFDNYTAHLSKTPGSMGKLLGTSTEYKKSIKNSISKIKKEILEGERKKKSQLTIEEKRKIAGAIVEKNKASLKVKYKKSYALLTNAEFGYFFAKHQKIIEDILKKQVLLSFYSAASGRGYIIFSGKRFDIGEYYEKNVSPPPFLKVGM